MKANEILRADSVTKRYGGVTAVHNVNLLVERGELVGLVGPNGAGKTTFFNALSGVAPPTEGVVRFKENDITNLPVHAIARMGMSRTFQNLRLFPALTVRDNVTIGAIGGAGASVRAALSRSPRRFEAQLEKTESLIQELGLSPQADQLAANLSYGGKKMLEIARALASSPELLLLDEPAAGLNDVETGKLGDLLVRLCAGGLTIVLVEHHMGLVSRICQKVAVLETGRLLASGPCREVMSDPAVVAAYLGPQGASDA